MKLFVGLAKGSGVKKVGEGRRINQSKENFISLFLRFPFGKSRCLHKFLVNGVPFRSDTLRRDNGTIGFKVGNIRKGTLNPLEDVQRNHKTAWRQ